MYPITWVQGFNGTTLIVAICDRPVLRAEAVDG